MNQLDLFLGAVVLLFALGGLFGGAVRRVIQIAALIIAFREAWRLAPWVESVLGGGDGQSIGGWGFIVPLIAFALIYRYPPRGELVQLAHQGHVPLRH